MSLREGDRVIANWRGEGSWYTGCVTAVVRGGAWGAAPAHYDVQYDDGAVEKRVAATRWLADTGGGRLLNDAIALIHECFPRSHDSHVSVLRRLAYTGITLSLRGRLVGLVQGTLDLDLE